MTDTLQAEHMLEWISEEVLPRAEADPELHLEDIQRLLTSWLMTGSTESAPEDLDEPIEAVTHTRRNIHDMSSSDATALQAAYRALNTTSNPTWGRFVFMHGVFGAIVHSRTGFLSHRFLPWHRLMVWKFERQIRATRGGSNLYIPYWTWWQPSSSSRKGLPRTWARFRPTINMPGLGDAETVRLIRLLLSSAVRQLFGDSFFGMVSRIVSAFTHPGTGASFLGGTLRVTRTGESALVAGTTSTGPRALDLPSKTTTRAALNQGSWSDFVRAFEPAPHGTPHVWIGDTADNDGLMRLVELSPADPLFFVHHCEVDRLWHLRQGRVTEGPVSVTGTQLPPWSETIAQVWNIASAPLEFAYENRTEDNIFV